MDTDLPILIAEDDENDAFILQRALRNAGFHNPFHISPDGADVIRYLKGEAPYHDREKFHFPRIIITDLKMPNIDGFELLEWLKNHEHCNIIPRLVFSSSQQPQDVSRAYRLGANSYLLKPATFEELVEQLKVVLRYWNLCQKPQVPSRC